MSNKKQIFFMMIFFMLFVLSSQNVLSKEREKDNNEYLLNIKDVSKLAIINNFDIQLARYDSMIADTNKGVSESIYDTLFTAEVNYRNNQNKQSSTILGRETTDNNYNVGLSKKTPSGTTINLNMDNNRNWTDSSFSSSPLTHQSSLETSIEQNLGRNFFGIQDRGSVKMSLIDIENSKYTSLDIIEDKLADIQKAYWDLVLQDELISVSEDMVSQAKALYDIHQEKLKDGLVEIPEAIASEANYKMRRNELLLIRNTRKAKENKLKLLLNIKESNTHIKTADKLIVPNIILEEKVSLKQAFNNRRDYKKAKNDIDSKKINLTKKKNNLWPEIDLTLSLKRNGLGDHFRTAVNNITDEDNPSFFAGLKVSFPIENRSARSKLKAAEIEKAKAILNMKYIEKKIAIGVMDRVRDCNIYREISLSDDEVAKLQSEKLKGEEMRFKVGRSDTDTLIRFQEDVIKSKEELSHAKYRFVISLIDLDLEKGSLLNKYWQGDI